MSLKLCTARVPVIRTTCVPIVQPACHSYTLHVIRTACASFVQPTCHSYSLRVICTACVSFVQPACHSYSLRVIRTACVSFVQPVCHSYSLCVIRTACVNGRVSRLTETGLVNACRHTARAPHTVAVGSRQDEREGRRDDSYSLCWCTGNDG